MRNPVAFALALFSTVLWILPASAYADRIGTPYRGPIELTGSGGGNQEAGTPGSEGGAEGGAEGGGSEGGTEGGGGSEGGAEGGSNPPTPGTNPGSGPGTGRGNTAKLDGTILWQWWWEHNKDRYLASATERGRVNMGSAYYWFGAGAKYPPREIDPVSEAQRTSGFFEVLQKLIADPNADVKAEACIAMGRLGDVPANDKQKQEDKSDNLVVRELIKATKDSHKQVRISALLGLGICGHKDGGEYLLRNHDGFSIEERAYANIAFGLMRYLPAVGHLLDSLPKSSGAKGTTDEQQAALHAIGLMGPGAVEELEKDGRKGISRIERLAKKNGSNTVTVMQAVATLGRLEQGRKTVASAFSSKSKDVQWTSVLALCNYAHDEKDSDAAAKLLMTKGYKAGESQIKNFSVLSLGELARKLDPNSKTRASILKFLKREALDTKNNYVRSCAAIALGVAGDKTAIDGIAALLSDTTVSDYVVGAAAVALGLLRATEHASAIRDKLLMKTKWDADARGYGALGIAMMGDTTRLDEIVKFGRSTDNRSKRQVPLAYGVLGDKKEVDNLARWFGKPWKTAERYNVSNAAYGLTWIKDQSAIEDLMRHAKSPDASVRGLAAVALGYVGSVDRVSPLARCYENISHRNRFGHWAVLHDIANIL